MFNSMLTVFSNKVEPSSVPTASFIGIAVATDATTASIAFSVH